MQQQFSLPQAEQLAMQLYQQQRLAEAEQLCQQILQVQPQQVSVLHLYAIIATQSGRHELALQQVAQAIQIGPPQAVWFNTQGNILLSLRRWQAAEQSFRQGLKLNPRETAIYRNLGLTYLQQDKQAAAQQHFAQAVELAPDFLQAWQNLAQTHENLQQPEQALAAWQRALALNPQNLKLRHHIFHLLQNLKRFTQAFSHAQETVQSLLPIPHESLENRQDRAKAWQNWATIQRVFANTEAALSACEKALALNPENLLSYSQLLWTLNFVTPPRWQRTQQLCAEFEAFLQRLNAPEAAPQWLPRAPHQRLRMGYLSVDLRDHPVGYFMLPILTEHDRQAFEIFCYYPNQASTPHTQVLRELAEHWRDVGQLSDAALRQRILDDEIDILVELGGHTEGNHLHVLVPKVAPVQVSYLGYPNTSGLRTIDYRITDIYVTPPTQETDKVENSEKLIRLPFAYHCYQPVAEAAHLPVAPLPALQNGFITFASFNNYSKLTDETLALWAEVLKRLPDSRLLLKTKLLNDEQARQHIEQRFQAFGIAPQRLLLHGSSPLKEYFLAHNQVDICLDSYPYSGGTITCNALWMGVPTLTLVGETQASRTSYSLLATVDLADWAAFEVDDFIQKALALTQDLPALQALREGMRERLQASALMDAKGFTKALEQAYQTMQVNSLNISKC